jgi:hypothetical protein
MPLQKIVFKAPRQIIELALVEKCRNCGGESTLKQPIHGESKKISTMLLWHEDVCDRYK